MCSEYLRAICRLYGELAFIGGATVIYTRDIYGYYQQKNGQKIYTIDSISKDILVR